MINYICQIQDGLILVEYDDGSFDIKDVGYPYPNIGCSNAKSIRNLLVRRCNLYKPEDFYLEKLGVLRTYLYNSFKYDFGITLEGIVNTIGLQSEYELSSSKIYRLYKYNGYSVLFIRKKTDKSKWLDSGSNKLVFTSDTVLTEYNFPVIDADDVIAQNVFTKLNIVNIFSQEVFRYLDTSYEFLKLIIKTMIGNNINYKSYFFAFSDKNTLVEQVINPDILNEYMTEDVIDLVCQWFKKDYKIDMSVSDFRDMMSVSGTSIGGCLSLTTRSESSIMLLVYCMRKNCGHKINIKQYKRYINIFIDYVLDAVAIKIEENIKFDESGIFYSALEGVTNPHLDELMQKFNMFADKAFVMMNALQYTDVTYNKIVWDLTKYMPKEIAPLGMFLFGDKSCFNEYYGNLEELFSTKIIDVLKEIHPELDDRIIIFDNNTYTGLKNSLENAIINKSIENGESFRTLSGYRYYKYLPESVINLVGDLTLLGRIYISDRNHEIFQRQHKVRGSAYKFYRCLRLCYWEAGKNIPLGVSTPDSHYEDLDFSQEYFDKHFKGAVLIYFLKEIYGETMYRNTLDDFRDLDLNSIEITYDRDMHTVDIGLPVKKGIMKYFRAN